MSSSCSGDAYPLVPPPAVNPLGDLQVLGVAEIGQQEPLARLQQRDAHFPVGGAAGLDQDVVRRHVAVHDVGLVQRRQRLVEVVGQHRQIGPGQHLVTQPDLLDPAPQVAPVGQLQHHVGLAGLGLTDLVDLGDRRAVERRQQVDLVEEAASHVAAEAVILGQHLDRDLAAGRLVEGAIDGGKAAGPDRCDDAVAADPMLGAGDGHSADWSGSLAASRARPLDRRERTVLMARPLPLGDLAVAEPLDVSQQHGLAEDGGQRIDGFAHHVALGHQRTHAALVAVAEGVVVGDDRGRPVAADLGDSGVAGQRVEPGRELRLTPVAVDRAGHRDEYLLFDLLGQHRIVDVTADGRPGQAFLGHQPQQQFQ